MLEVQLNQDKGGPDVSLSELYNELQETVRGMDKMAEPSEIAAAIEDKDLSPQQVVRTLASAVVRSSSQGRSSAGGSASVSRGAGFEDAVLAHLGSMATAMQGIATALGAKPKAVHAALQVLAGEEDEDEEVGADGKPLSAHTHTHACASVRTCAFVRSRALLIAPVRCLHCSPCS